MVSIAGLTVTSTAGLGAPMIHVCISGSLGVLEWTPGARTEAEEEERKEEVRSVGVVLGHGYRSFSLLAVGWSVEGSLTRAADADVDTC